MWGATNPQYRPIVCWGISIHAPRVGSDKCVIHFLLELHNFNPRSPCGERLCSPIRPTRYLPFQSTLPVWGATGAGKCADSGRSYFNPRSPCGERLHGIGQNLQHIAISIHAPRVGSDWSPPAHPCSGTEFQSTLPVWGATTGIDRTRLARIISIHAPRVGSDYRAFVAEFVREDFNPRSPCGERPRRP